MHESEGQSFRFRFLDLVRINSISKSCDQRYDEAAQHILDALVLQDNDGEGGTTTLNQKRGVVSSALWETLRSTCLQMLRPDLTALCDSKDLEGNV